MKGSLKGSGPGLRGLMGFVGVWSLPKIILLRGLNPRSRISIRVPSGHTHPQKYLPISIVKIIMTAIGSIMDILKLKCVNSMSGSNLRKGLNVIEKGSRDLRKTYRKIEKKKPCDMNLKTFIVLLFIDVI